MWQHWLTLNAGHLDFASGTKGTIQLNIEALKRDLYSDKNYCFSLEFCHISFLKLRPLQHQVESTFQFPHFGTSKDDSEYPPRYSKRETPAHSSRIQNFVAWFATSLCPYIICNCNLTHVDTTCRQPTHIYILQSFSSPYICQLQERWRSNHDAGREGVCERLLTALRRALMSP